MPLIRSLRPNVSREQAIRAFSQGAWGIIQSSMSGPLRSVAEFYVPFQLYQAEICNGGKHENRFFGLDAVTGSLDLYRFERVPTDREIICCESRNCIQSRLEEAQAAELLRAKLQRMLFNSGFFRIRNLEIRVEPFEGEIHVPYWVGFRGQKRYASFIVMDAVRRRVEGAKVRQMFEAWLTSID
jgi:hypothetical protein